MVILQALRVGVEAAGWVWVCAPGVGLEYLALYYLVIFHMRFDIVECEDLGFYS